MIFSAQFANEPQRADFKAFQLLLYQLFVRCLIRPLEFTLRVFALDAAVFFTYLALFALDFLEARLTAELVPRFSTLLEF